MELKSNRINGNASAFGDGREGTLAFCRRMHAVKVEGPPKWFAVQGTFCEFSLIFFLFTVSSFLFSVVFLFPIFFALLFLRLLCLGILLCLVFLFNLE